MGDLSLPALFSSSGGDGGMVRRVRRTGWRNAECRKSVLEQNIYVYPW